MVIGVYRGDMVCSFLGEDFGIFNVFCGEGFLRFLSLSFHSEVHGQSEFVYHGSGGRGEELRSTSLDVIDEKGVHSSFCELFWEFSTKVLAKAVLF